MSTEQVTVDKPWRLGRSELGAGHATVHDRESGRSIGFVMRRSSRIWSAHPRVNGQALQVGEYWSRLEAAQRVWEVVSVGRLDNA